MVNLRQLSDSESIGTRLAEKFVGDLRFCLMPALTPEAIRLAGQALQRDWRVLAYSFPDFNQPDVRSRRR